MVQCLIGLGSNVGDRAANIADALARLAEHDGIEVAAASHLHATAPVGGPAGQTEFLNAAAVVTTSLSPPELLGVLQQLEEIAGRQRDVRWGPRTLDLDLLLYGDVVQRSADLEVPHPRMAFRRFVLAPAAEVAAEMVHPLIGRRVGQLLAHLDGHPNYVAITGPIGVGKSWLAERLVTRMSARLIAEQVDEPRLTAFYADPGGRAWQTQLEFLRDRRRVLIEDAWLEPEQLAVSDFWFDQSLAFAAVWLDRAGAEEFRRRFEDAREGVQTPKLLVVLDAPSTRLLDSIHHRGRSYEADLTAGKLDQLRGEIADLTSRQGPGPILRLAGDDAEENLGEVTAAIEAMQ